MPELNPESTAFRAALDVVRAVEPRIAAAIAKELHDQRESLKLIASENYASPAVLLAMGNWLSDKYAEGTIGRRFYAGCQNVDTVEAVAGEHAEALFNAPYAYVQPHAGGHLTHGFRPNISGKMFNQRSYGVDPATGQIDYAALRETAREFKPLIIVGGYSAYPRKVNFRIMREIADEVGATFMVDMAHFAGLVAGKVFTGDFDPIPHAHIVTMTTHKSLRGPRGGAAFCQPELADQVDRGCPMVLGGPLGHVMAAKAIAFAEARRPEFADYAQRIVDNSQALAEGLTKRGVRLVSGGTDNHLVLLDVHAFGLTGRQAEQALLESGIVTNRNAIPQDPNGAWYTSGIRIGTPALTTRGLGTAEMDQIAELMHTVLTATKPGSS